MPWRTAGIQTIFWIWVDKRSKQQFQSRIFRMSTSPAFSESSRVHLNRNSRWTSMSASKIWVGMALSATGRSCGQREMTKQQHSLPFPFTTSGPRNSANRRAELRATPFDAPQSESSLLSTRDSCRQSRIQWVSMAWPLRLMMARYFLAMMAQCLQHSARLLPMRYCGKISSWKTLVILSSPLRFISKPLNYLILLLKLKTTYLFLSICVLCSWMSSCVVFCFSLAAGIIIALQGPSISKKMVISFRVPQRHSLADYSHWYWSLAYLSQMRWLRMWQGQDTLSDLPDWKTSLTSSGKPWGRSIQMPSVSSSSGLPILPSMKFLLSLMMLEPRQVTIAAISIEYHRAPFRITYPQKLLRMILCANCIDSQRIISPSAYRVPARSFVFERALYLFYEVLARCLYSQRRSRKARTVSTQKLFSRMQTTSARVSVSSVCVFLQMRWEQALTSALMAFSSSCPSPSNLALIFSRICRCSPSFRGKTVPRHSHSSSRLHLFSGWLKRQPEQIWSLTMETGCRRLVRMMFGYIAATSMWQIRGKVSCLWGERTSRRTSNRFTTSDRISYLFTAFSSFSSGISTEMAKRRISSTLSIRSWKAEGLRLKSVGKSARYTPVLRHSTLPPVQVSVSSRFPLWYLSISSSFLLGKMMPRWQASAMSRFSQRVPLPLRRTQSGNMGMMVASASMKPWMCLMQRKQVATASEMEYSASRCVWFLASHTMSSGSTSIGSQFSLAFATAFSPREPCGRKASLSTQQKQSRWAMWLPQNSPLCSETPSSAVNLRKLSSMRLRMQGQSNLSPLQVVTMWGLQPWMKLAKRTSRSFSEGSLKTVTWQANSGLGQQSNCSTGWPQKPRLTTRKASPSYMRLIIMISSFSASGNFSGSFAVSMSNDRIFSQGTPRCPEAGRKAVIILSSRSTSNHLPARRPVSMQTREWKGTSNSRMAVMRSVTSRASLVLAVPQKGLSSSCCRLRRLSRSPLRGFLALVRSRTVRKLTLRYYFLRPERWLTSSRSAFSSTSIDSTFSSLDSRQACTSFSAPSAKPTQKQGRQGRRHLTSSPSSLWKKQSTAMRSSLSCNRSRQDLVLKLVRNPSMLRVPSLNATPTFSSNYSRQSRVLSFIFSRLQYYACESQKSP